MPSMEKFAAYRNTRTYPLVWAFVIALAVSLGGCGGGGGDSSNTSLPPAANAAAVAISSQPTDQAAMAGGTATFSVAASGDGLHYQWQTSSDAGATWADIAGANAAAYTIGTVSSSQSGNSFRVVITGQASTVASSSVGLSVAAAVVAPTIAVQPSAQTSTVGNTAVFAITASGAGLAYQWQTSSDGGTTWSDISGQTNATWMMSNLSASDNGKLVRVVVSNTQGIVRSDALPLTVNPAPAGVSVANAPADASVVAPAGASFAVVATGSPSPSYQWQVSTDNGNSFSNIVGATGATYTTPATSTADTGKQFRVVVSNSGSSVTSGAAGLSVAKVQVAPSISAAPVNASVTVPSTATFSVTASGTPTPNYQWQLSTDGGASFANITGATATSYTTPATSAADSGKRYRVTVTNTQGSVSSAAAALAVAVMAAAATPHRMAIGHTGYALLLKADGTVLSLGTGAVGGSGPSVTGAAATAIPGATGIASIATPKDIDASTINLAVRQDGTLLVWGRDLANGGGLGAISPSGPVAVNAPTAVSQLHGVVEARPVAGSTLARLTDGSLWLLGGSVGYTVSGTSTSWFVNATQITGLGSVVSVSAAMSGSNNAAVPIVSADGSVTLLTITNAFSGSSATSGNTVTRSAVYTMSVINGLPPVAQVDCSGSLTMGYNCLGLTRAGTVWSWGTRNNDGQLGNGTLTGVTIPAQVAGLSGITQVVATESNGYALTGTGRVYSWGDWNGLGFDPLAGGTLADRSRPSLVPTLTGVAEIAASTYAAMARKLDGTVWGWGSNSSGELGTGTTAAAVVPTQAVGINLN